MSSSTVALRSQAEHGMGLIGKLRKRPESACIAVGLASFLVWLPTLWGGFLHDDYMCVEKGIAASIGAGRVGRLAMMMIFQSTKEQPWLYHLYMISVHAVNAVFIYCIARQLSLKTKVAMCSAMAYSISYLAADAVLWSVTVSWSCAVYGSLLLILRNPNPNRFWLQVSLPLLGIAFVGPFLHEGVVAVPAIVFCYGIIVKRDAKYVILSLLLLLSFALSILLQIEICRAMGYEPFTRSLLAAFYQEPLGVSSNIVSAFLFLFVSPWYQVLRLAGLGASVGILISAGIASLFVVVGRDVFQRGISTTIPTALWIVFSILICLLPGSVLGIGGETKWPTMGSRYLYPAWGLFVILVSVVLFADKNRIGLRKHQTELLVGSFLLLNALLVGISEFGYLKRCALDKKLVGLVAERLSTCHIAEARDSEPVILSVYGDFQLLPFVLPSPQPGLTPKNPGGIKSMLKMNGISIDAVEIAKTIPPKVLPPCTASEEGTIINVNVAEL